MKSITRENGRIVIRLTDQVGGARRALQRRLDRAAEVGNEQIRLDLGQLEEGWEEPLIDTITQFTEFRERMATQLLSAAAGSYDAAPAQGRFGTT